MKKVSPVLLAGILIGILALVTRLLFLGSVPVSLYWDEAAMLVEAKALAATGRDMHGNPWMSVLFPSYGDYKLPVFIWLASLSVKILGASAFALRLPSALAGLGTIVVLSGIAYHLAAIIEPKSKQIAKKIIALLTAAITTITPWAVLFSRTGFEGHLGQFFVASSVLTLLLSKYHKWWLLLTVFLGTAATYTYFSVRFVWPVVFLLVWVMLLLPKIIVVSSHLDFISQLKKQWKNTALQFLLVLLCLGAYFASLAPMITSPLYETSNQFRLSTNSILNAKDYAVESNTLRQLAGESLLDRVVFHRHVLMFRELLFNYSDHLDLRFLFLTGDPNLRHGTGVHGLFLLPFLPILIWGGVLLAKKNLSVLLTLLGWWLIAILPAAVPETTPHALRSLNAMAPLILLLSLGCWLCWQELQSSWTHLTKILTRAWFAWVVLAATTFFYHYAVVYPSVSSFDWQDGYYQVTEYIFEHNSSVRTVWVAPFEDRLYLWLLAFGPYKGDEFVSIPTVGYKVVELENIVFLPFPWEKLTDLDHKTIVIGLPGAIEEQLKQAPIPPKEITPIYGGDGSTIRFTAVLFEPI